MTTIQEPLTSAWKTAESDRVTTDPARRKTEDETKTVAPIIEDKPLVLLQVNCMSIYNKTLDFWNLTDTYNPDVVIGTELLLCEEINNAEFFRDDYVTFRRDKHSRLWSVYLCKKMTLLAPNYGLTRYMR